MDGALWKRENMMRAILESVRSTAESKASTRALWSGASALAFAMVLAGSPAFAQATDSAAKAAAAKPAAEGETIVVTGIRGSLKTSQGIKKSSDTIVDSVTAEDIGALPDRSVTETLQRIPGVSIDRFAAGADPDHFSVEGSGVTIRGLSYVRSEINGRDAFTVNNGRGLSFADVPSELLYGVDVFKSPSADRIEGGISGVVNLRTRLPFDSKGLTMSASAENSYGDFSQKSAPTFSGLVSDRWSTGIGDIGILISGVSSELISRSDKLQIAGYLPRTLYANGNVISNPSPGDAAPVSAATKQVYFPAGADFGTENYDRRRFGASAALQWRSNDHKWEATAQFLRSDSREHTLENTVDIAADNVENPGNTACNGTDGCQGLPRGLPGSTLTFGNDGTFTNGIITGPTGWRADQGPGQSGPVGRVPAYGLQSNNISRSEEQQYLTNDVSFNLKWHPSQHFDVSVDYQHVYSKVNEFSAGLWLSTYQNASINLTNGGLPAVAFIPPVVCNGPLANGSAAQCASGIGGYVNLNNSYLSAGHTSYLDPYNSFYRAAMDHAEQNDGTDDAFRADATYTLPDNNWVKSIQGGGRYSDRNQTARFSTYNWGVLSEQWGNGGPIWADNPAIANSANLTPNTFPNYFGGQIQQPAAGRLFYNGDGTSNYASYSAFATSIVNAWLAQGGNAAGSQGGGSSGWVPLANRQGVVAGTNYLPSEINPLDERNISAYLETKLDHRFENGWRLSGTVGLRFSQTDRKSSGLISDGK